MVRRVTPIGLAASLSSQTTINRTMRMALVEGFSASDDRAETSEIAEAFPNAETIRGVSAAPAQVMAALRASEIFHFTGHAVAGRQPQLLLASHDPCSALSAAAFETERLPGCRLVVLAACNTTAADPDRIEQLPDLRNNLLLAGAQTVIASSWDVDDRSTRALMLAFYRQAQLGITPSRSLQVAQQNVRTVAAWQHPFYWASFATFTQ